MEKHKNRLHMHLDAEEQAMLLHTRVKRKGFQNRKKEAALKKDAV